ncbi:hypothetical protein ACOSQ3_006088 [Xanthoceras sorbifolium]
MLACAYGRVLPFSNLFRDDAFENACMEFDEVNLRRAYKIVGSTSDDAFENACMEFDGVNLRFCRKYQRCGGVLEGLQLAWRAGFSHVLLESDSLETINLLLRDANENHPLASCRGLIDGNWSCSVRQ